MFLPNFDLLRWRFLPLNDHFWLASARFYLCSLLIALGRDVHRQANCKKRKETLGCVLLSKKGKKTKNISKHHRISFFFFFFLLS